MQNIVSCASSAKRLCVGLSRLGRRSLANAREGFLQCSEKVFRVFGNDGYKRAESIMSNMLKVWYRMY